MEREGGYGSRKVGEREAGKETEMGSYLRTVIPIFIFASKHSQLIGLESARSRGLPLTSSLQRSPQRGLQKQYWRLRRTLNSSQFSCKRRAVIYPSKLQPNRHGLTNVLLRRVFASELLLSALCVVVFLFTLCYVCVTLQKKKWQEFVLAAFSNDVLLSLNKAINDVWCCASHFVCVIFVFVRLMYSYHALPNTAVRVT